MTLNRGLYAAILALSSIFCCLFGKAECTDVSRLLKNATQHVVAVNDESNEVSTNPLTDPCSGYSCAIDPPNQCTIIGCSCGRFDRICRSRNNF